MPIGTEMTVATIVIMSVPTRPWAKPPDSGAP